MAVYYLDASAIVKYFHGEPGSAWVRQLAERLTDGGRRANEIYLTELSRVEVPAAFAILARNRQITVRTRDGMYRSFLQQLGKSFESLRLTPEIIEYAAELTQTHPLKAYDAVQLATALAFEQSLKGLNLSLIFVSADKTLLQTAEAEGLQADNPLNHA